MKVTTAIIMNFIKHHGYLSSYKNGPCNKLIMERKLYGPVEVSKDTISKWHDREGVNCECCKIPSQEK